MGAVVRASGIALKRLITSGGVAMKSILIESVDSRGRVYVSISV